MFDILLDWETNTDVAGDKEDEDEEKDFEVEVLGWGREVAVDRCCEERGWEEDEEEEDEEEQEEERGEKEEEEEEEEEGKQDEVEEQEEEEEKEEEEEEEDEEEQEEDRGEKEAEEEEEEGEDEKQEEEEGTEDEQRTHPCNEGSTIEGDIRALTQSSFPFPSLFCEEDKIDWDVNFVLNFLLLLWNGDNSTVFNFSPSFPPSFLPSLPSSLTALLITFVNFSGLRADPDEEDGEKMEFENGNIEEEGYFELRIIVISELEIVSW